MYEIIISIIALGASIVIPTIQYFIVIGGMQADIKNLKLDGERNKEMCDKVISLETKITPFWNWIDRELPNMIKGKSGRVDVLLTKYMGNPSLTGDEKWELIDLLKDKYNESTDMGKRLAISLFISKLEGDS